jgi:hypothetical protein
MQKERRLATRDEEERLRKSQRVRHREEEVQGDQICRFYQ